MEPFASICWAKFTNYPSWAINYCSDSGTVVVKHGQKKEVPSPLLSTNLHYNSIFTWVTSAFPHRLQLFIQSNSFYSQNVCWKKIQWTMATFLLQRKKRIVKKNVFTWLSATARHFGLTTKKPNGATSKWQATQSKILNFGRETLIAPAAIQMDVEVSLIFSSSKQCFSFHHNVICCSL